MVSSTAIKWESTTATAFTVSNSLACTNSDKQFNSISSILDRTKGNKLNNCPLGLEVVCEKQELMSVHFFNSRNKIPFFFN